MVTDTDQISDAEVIVEFIEELDAFLLRSVSRDRFSTIELQDMLFDLRQILQSDTNQN